MRRTQVLALCASLLALSGCGTGGKDATARATATVTATATATVTKAPAVPTAAHPAHMGQKISGKYVTAAVLKVDPQTPVDPSIKDQKRWYSVLVKVCGMVDHDEKGKPITVSWAPWNVGDSDGARYDVTGWTGGIVYPIPTYPQDDAAQLIQGQCIKGCITFNVAPNAKISRVIYSGTGGNPVVWKVVPRN